MSDGSRVDRSLCHGGAGIGTGSRDQRSVKIVLPAKHGKEVGQGLIAEDGDNLFLLEFQPELRSEDQYKIALEDIVSMEEDNADDQQRNSILHDGGGRSWEVLTVDVRGREALLASVHRLH